MIALLLSLAVAQAPMAEPSRAAGQYFIQKSGVVWIYEQGKTKGRSSIGAFVDWKASFTFSMGKRSASGTWRVKEGAWLERSAARGEGEVVLLPANLTRGARWTAPASIERGGGGVAQYEVMTLDAVVELPNGITVENCLAVLETKPDGTEPYTHYWAPNIGKVGVRGPEDWLYRLVEFRPGRRGHSE